LKHGVPVARLKRGTLRVHRRMARSSHRESESCMQINGIVRPSRNGVIGVLPGEGVGPEVVASALQVLDAVGSMCGQKPECVYGPAIGFAATGAGKEGELTEDVAVFCREILGAGGVLFCGPGGGRFVYDLRKRIDLFCKLAPICPRPALRRVTRLKDELLSGVDIMIVRDNAAGVYQGHWSQHNDPQHGRVCTHHFSYSQQQVERIVDIGVALARQRRQRMHIVLKDGGIPGISALWREVGEKLAAKAEIKCLSINVDHAAYRLIQHPCEFDVVVAPNMFGDVLADLAAVLIGSRGMSYSGNFGADGSAAYQTGHGAAHDLAGRDRANPLAQILSLAMMLRISYQQPDAADMIDQAVDHALEAGFRTDDIMENGCRLVGTREMASRVAQAVAERCMAVSR
jgi:3-isopropylmalate dehydrogenase